jgi:hypothetical protein
MQHKPDTIFGSETVLLGQYVNISTSTLNIVISGRHKVKYHPMSSVGEAISLFFKTTVMLNLSTS